MANSVLWKGKLIWRGSNSLLDIIYQPLKKIIAENNQLNLPERVYTIIERLDQDIFGDGCCTIDASNYLYTKDEILCFANLLEKAIFIAKNNHNWTEEIIQRAESFYKNLRQEANNSQ